MNSILTPKNSDYRKSNIPKRKKNTSSSLPLFSAILIFVTLILTIIIIIGPLLLIFFFLVKKGIILIHNGNNIVLPSGKKLYDLRTFTYRNGSLYTYNNQNLILEEEDEEDVRNTFSTATDSNDKIFTISPRIEVAEDPFRCSGKCECYEDDVYNRGNSERRNVGNLIYSYRFASVLVMSTIGVVAAKFVNDQLDECYKMTKRKAGEGLTCVMDEIKCEAEKYEKEGQGHKLACMGYCVLDEEKFGEVEESSSFRTRVDAVEIIDYFDYRGETIPIEYDYRWGKVQCEKGVHPWIGFEILEDFHEEDRLQLAAKRYFAALHLIPFCEAWEYSFPHDSGDKKFGFCTGDTDNARGPSYYNVNCVRPDNM